MKRLLCALIALFCAVALAVHFSVPSVDAQSSGCTDQALALAEGQITDTLAYTNTSQFPVSTNTANANKWNLANSGYWTSGFFPGELWIMYEKNLTDSWLTRAQAQTASMQAQDVNAPDHDIGFKILGTYGNAYRITRDPADMAVIQTAANAMATNLWRPGAGVIESWPNYDSHITVIIDNMMNLELLLLAAQNGGNPAWRDMAVSHALKTIQNHVRADGSTFHVVDYNTDGTVFSQFTSQGASNASTWSRGQAWGLNGFTMVYRYTKNDPSVPVSTSSSFLATAQRLADYFINHLPPDFVPYWDFSQSGTAPRDSSAAAIAAAGLFELSAYVAPTDSARYRTAALNILSSLSSPAYLGDRLATDGILLHGSANVPGNSGVDTSLIYGDYYFIQGCYRARTAPTAPLNLTATPTSSGQVNLTWDAQSGPIRYSVKRSATSSGPFTTIAPPPILTANTFTDTHAAPGTNYYVVNAINASGASPDSAQASATISSAPTSTSLASSANPSAFGHSVTFTAAVHPSTSGTPTGSITFKDGTATLGTVALASDTASFTSATLTAQSHSITAAYSGDTNFGASTSPILSQSITKAATSIILTASPSASRFGQPVAFYAAVKSATSGTPTGTVTFKDGATILGTGTLSLGHAKISTLKLAVGSHPLTAIYNGNPNFTASASAVLNFVTSKAAISTAVVSSLNPSKTGSAVTFTATVKSSTTGIPAGSATFKDGTTILATVTLTSGKAAFTTSTLAAGSHTITAVYNGSSSFNPSTSPTLAESVNP
jgi:Bacterial Ig-like domain (group 3)/Glycosyl Hydrolase Family 88